MAGKFNRLSVGQVIADRYTLLEKLSEGGMAVVFRAKHNTTERLCALKTMHPDLVSHPKAREQFRKEAKVAGRLASHPNIVEVFDAGIDDHHIPFIAMELLSGETLGEYLQSHHPLRWDTIGLLLDQLAGALDEAHDAGVVHRDLKPGNLFITKNRRGQLVLKVLDFGIAKLMDREREKGISTATQLFTPWYSAPEQLDAGVRKLAKSHGYTISKGVSPTTDIWALGLLAMELVTGTTASEYWEAESVGDLVIRLALEPVTPPSQHFGDRIPLPGGFDAWFLRCLQHDATKRWPTAGEAVAELLLLLQQNKQASLPDGGLAALEDTAPMATDEVIAQARAQQAGQRDEDTVQQPADSVERASQSEIDGDANGTDDGVSLERTPHIVPSYPGAATQPLPEDWLSEVVASAVALDSNDHTSSSGASAIIDEYKVLVRYEGNIVGPVSVELAVRGYDRGRIPDGAEICRLGHDDWQSPANALAEYQAFIESHSTIDQPDADATDSDSGALSEDEDPLATHDESPPSSTPNLASPNENEDSTSTQAASDVTSFATFTPWLSKRLREVRPVNLSWRHAAIAGAAASLLTWLAYCGLGNSVSETTATPAAESSALAPPEAEPAGDPPESAPSGSDTTVPQQAPSATAAASPRLVAVPTSAAPSRPPASSGDKPDHDSQRNRLYQKAMQGRATYAELRQLKGLCMADGDRECRSLAVRRLRERDTAPAPKSPPQPTPSPDLYEGE